MTCYRLFGLAIRSPYPLEAPQIPEPCDADVTIEFGPVPETLVEGTRYNAYNWTAPGQVLVTLPDTARCLITEGRHIRVDVFPGAEQAALTLFSGGSPLAAILHQRGNLVFHASGVLTRKGVVLFTAPSGVGKSTTAAALAARGHALVTDDMAVVEQRGTEWQVFPGPSRLKLWPDSLRALDIEAAPLAPVRDGLNKRFLPMVTADAAELRLAAVVGLGAHGGDSGVSVRQLPREQAVALLMHNTYRRRMQVAVSGPASNLARVAPLAATLPCFSVQRSAYGLAVDALADAIESLVDGL